MTPNRSPARCKSRAEGKCHRKYTAPHTSRIMYYVYLLRSKKTGSFYIGYTSDLRKRFSEHNTGKAIATKAGMSYELIYYEAYLSRKDAMAREKTLKYHGQGIRKLKERLIESIRDATCVRGKGEKVR